ncbi:hypothetical protein PUNSTDRAFT_59508 [Punctularia strigosozonata HHB-11173 SS5]|uniref:uncharacterized protein n=1 Tax=Punctularia strigosozonata (strain HHB-11173) TaxID=741275 RepID=UPI0004416934|nr:uncharacterized protein PUNSTDRAFT_59508 [Punctularia strigosozonata HHB-11173 SS5]EIN13159.1 hypothetical protein PUNSTDRAFT_59508 [Punctularia strigosozonata HHB-11173 SS5]
MPARGDRSAPVFRQASDLPGYLEELERLFTEHNITDERQKIDHAIRYLPYDEARIWRSAEAFTDVTKSYADFRKEITDLYPGTALEGQATRADIESLVSARAATPIRTRTELGEYNRRFKVIADDLRKKHNGALFSENDANDLFLRGFTGDLRDRLLRCLQTALPTHNFELAYPRATVFKEADAILSGQRGPTTLFTSAPPATLKQEDIATAVRSAVDARMSSVENLLTVFISSFGTAAGARSQAGTASNSPQAPSLSHPSDLSCLFCGGPHLIRNCEVVLDYIKQGKVMRNGDGKLVLPSGAYIPSSRSTPGATMQARAGRVIYPPKVPRPAGHTGTRNVAPIEEDLVVGRLVDDILDAPLPNVTGRQLLGASYAARRELASRITPRKVSADPDSTTALFSSGPPPSLDFDCDDCGGVHRHVSAYPMQRLRVLRPLIANAVIAECVIDSGSEAVLMRKDVWLATGFPLYEDDAISLTAANSTTTRTLGGLRNVPFNIGGMEVYLQVQVIEDAPWEVLLGRSFLTHTSCITSDKIDGSSILTLTNPETGERIRVPTLERPVAVPPARKQGFP